MSGIYNPAIERLDMPLRFRKLPVDHRGFPVPKFVEWIDGKADFRVVDGRFLVKAIRLRLCWLCGEPLGRHMAFVIGPMCAINRTSSEPPSHLDCARFAVKACPFLTQPKRPRDYSNRPDEAVEPAGVMIERNPGVSLIWVTGSYRQFKARGGVLIKIGEPTLLEWWTRARPATRAEIMQSIETGLPTLRDMAEQEGARAVAELERQVVRGLALVPAA